MAYTQQYSPGYTFDFEYRTPPRPSPQANGYGHHRYSSFNTPSPRGSPNAKAHARRVSQEYYSSGARGAAPPQYTSHASPRHYSTYQSSPLRPEYVSGDFDRMRAKAPRSRPDPRPGFSHWGQDGARSSNKFESTRQYYSNVVEDDDIDGYGFGHFDAPPPYEPYPRFPGADPYSFQDAAYGTHPHHQQYQPTPERPRTARRPATSGGGQPQPQPTSKPRRPSTATKTPPRQRATEEDARRARIPAGYSYKNWDPSEEPITLLGSVFDANSLGKWIYDWTVYRYGAATPFSDIAGDLWLLLIQLAGKVKRADNLMPRIRRDDSRELVEDFLESGERLWIRFKKLLKICEDYMWKAAKRSSGEKRPMQMGKDSGCEFVDSLFGRDRELDKTERLMSSIRLWSMRFDANCEEILRNPTA